MLTGLHQGVGGSHSWEEGCSCSDWPVLVSRTNLTRRPPRPRRCHTEHSQPHWKHHNSKNWKIHGWRCNFHGISLGPVVLFPARCQVSIRKMTNSSKHIWSLWWWWWSVLIISSIQALKVSFNDLIIMFSLFQVCDHYPLETDLYPAWNGYQTLNFLYIQTKQKNTNSWGKVYSNEVFCFEGQRRGRLLKRSYFTKSFLKGIFIC